MNTIELFKKHRAQMLEFHDLYEILRFQMPAHVPRPLLNLRARLIREEALEVRDATDSEHKVKEMTDLYYVTLGTYTTLGLSYIEPADPAGLLDWSLWAQKAAHALADRTFCARSIQRNLDYLTLSIFDWFVHPEKLDFMFQIVHTQNMAKLWAAEDLKTITHNHFTIKPKGSLFLVKDAYGKVIKPPTMKGH